MKKILFLGCIIITSLVQGQVSHYAIKNIEANTKFQDFGISYLNDSTVIFSSSEKNVFLNRNWNQNQQPFLDFFQGTLDNSGEIHNIQPYEKGLNTKYHDANLVFSSDGNTLYFSSNNYYHKKYKTDSTGVNRIQIYKASKDETGKWESIEKLPFNSDNFDTGHPALSSDETKLFFISNRPGGYGATDIYYVNILENGTYGPPINLGAKINTRNKEMFPFIDEKNHLYFSSDGYPDGLGNLDIYAINLDSPNYAPTNLKAPINSVSDDFGFVKPKGSNKGHFSSNRTGGKGSDDIYSFKELRPVNFKCFQKINGNVYNNDTKKNLDKVSIFFYEGDTQIGNTISNKEGYYELDIPCSSSVNIIASKSNFLKFEEKVQLENDTIFKKNIFLTPENIATTESSPEKMVLNIPNIYFDYNKATIKPESESSLEKVVQILKENPEFIIQIQTHTDSRGSDNFNLLLSEKRAKSCKDWIIKHGISATKIITQGFGETSLLNECSNSVKCSEEKHKINRRTKFIVLNQSN